MSCKMSRGAEAALPSTSPWLRPAEVLADILGR